MADCYIIDAARTPRGVGKPGKGALSHFHSGRLLAKVFEAIGERNNLKSEDIDDIVIGCSTQVGNQSNDVGRMAALDAGWSEHASGVTLDRFCGSGITSANIAAANIMAGMDDLCVAGGVEMMSYTATLSGKDRNNNRTVDGGNLHLRDQHPQPHQGICADMIATLEGFSREDVDALAVESQKRAQHAIENGHFDKSVITVMNDDGSVALDREEFPRPGTTMESLAELKTVFDQFMGVPIDNDGETFSKATSLADNQMVQFPTYYNPVPGVTMIMSDPIHGSLGAPKVKMEDLTPEQQFEESQRRKKPVVFEDDEEHVVGTRESIKWAEENTGGKFPEPTPKEDMKKPVKYTLHDSDDEDDDTVETRKSVKTAEKYYKHRFFINAKEKK